MRPVFLLISIPYATKLLSRRPHALGAPRAMMRWRRHAGGAMADEPPRAGRHSCQHFLIDQHTRQRDAYAISSRYARARDTTLRAMTGEGK